MKNHMTLFQHLNALHDEHNSIIEYLEYLENDILPYPLRLNCAESIISVEFEVPESEQGGAEE